MPLPLPVPPHQAPPVAPHQAPLRRAWATYVVVTMAGGAIALALLYDLSVLTASCWLLATATPALALVTRALARLRRPDGLPPPSGPRAALALAVLVAAATPPLVLYLITG